MVSPITTPTEKVKNSSRYAAENAIHVIINKEALQNFAQNKITLPLKPRSLRPYPLKFISPAHEINFHVLLAVLSFGSGFKKECNEICQRSPQLTIIYGVLSMVIGGAKLDMEYLNSVTLGDIQSLFDIKIDQDVPHESIPGLYISRPSALRPFADKIHSVISTCGRKLAELQCRDFSHYLQKIMEENPSVDRFISMLSRDFPPFSDQGKLSDGTDVYLFSKAQRLIHDLILATSASRELQGAFGYVRFLDPKQLTVFSDNVLPAILRHEGVLQYSPHLSSIVDGQQPIPSGPLETELRAVTVEACEQILDIIGRDANSAVDLDDFLRTLKKDEEHHSIVRHLCKDTTAY
eukprot:TRINITY_DN1141_c0_g1_i2.p1 TRINITY_DN1141_c0_g1~~TRINITY_DN1141_c0_g1_i2.p1  ORF type:complete len:350 (+),score=52.01 TRINITY_DN1141_c0_g1_i2:273-1322(+)